MSVDKVSETNSALETSATQSCSSSNSQSIPESPVSQRCGSAPPSFASSSLKCSASHFDGVCCPNHNLRTTDGKTICCSCQQIQQSGRKMSCGTASVSQPYTSHNSGEEKLPFSRGLSYSSARSLSAGRSTPTSSFLRRKYRTISLRRIRRTNLNRQVTLLATSVVLHLHTKLDFNEN